MNKYSTNDDLVGISVTFRFEGMQENNYQFDELQLFENEKNIHVKNRVERPAVGAKCYDIRIFSDLNNYTEVLDLVFEEMKSQFPKLTKLGLSEGIVLEFFLEYHEEIQWTLHHTHLLKLNSLSNSSPGISLNSIDRSWNDGKEAHKQEIFHQLIFSSENVELEKEFIQKKWKEAYVNTYESVQNWQLATKKGNNSKELILSIKEDINLFNWKEPWTSLLNFYSKHAAAFSNKNISTIYGFYQQNRSNMNGGEIGPEIVKELSRLKIDLRFTLSQKAP